MRRILIALALAWPSLTWATGWHHVPVIVKPAAIAPAAPAVTSVPVAATPASTTPAGTAQTSTAGGGGGPGVAGWLAVGFVVSFIGETIWTHILWCAEDDKKPANERQCYRPLRDGMP